jgi:hypothetical protein
LVMLMKMAELGNGDNKKMNSCVPTLHLLQILQRGCGSMVECGLPKPETRVRFPSPAPLIINDLRKSASKVQVNSPIVRRFLGLVADGLFHARRRIG